MKKIDWQISVTLKNLFLSLRGFKETKSFFTSGCCKLICAVRVLTFLYNILLGDHIILILTTLHPKGRSRGGSEPLGKVISSHRSNCTCLFVNRLCLPIPWLNSFASIIPVRPQTSSSSLHHSPLLIVRTHHWYFCVLSSYSSFPGHIFPLCVITLFPSVGFVTDLSITGRTVSLTSSYHNYWKIASVWSAKTFSDIIVNLTQSRTPSSRSAPYL